jgi:hypothetical protein
MKQSLRVQMLSVLTQLKSSKPLKTQTEHYRMCVHDNGAQTDNRRDKYATNQNFAFRLQARRVCSQRLSDLHFSFSLYGARVPTAWFLRPFARLSLGLNFVSQASRVAGHKQWRSFSVFSVVRYLF